MSANMGKCLAFGCYPDEPRDSPYCLLFPPVIAKERMLIMEWPSTIHPRGNTNAAGAMREGSDVGDVFG
jgi:hypothetical protein